MRSLPQLRPLGISRWVAPRRRVGGEEERNLALASFEQSRDASGDGGPRKVGLVGSTTAGSKIRTVLSIGKDSD